MSHRWIWLFAGLGLLGTVQAGAEPYFAAWKGVNCNACHVNQTGGWLRNDFGKNYGNSLSTFDWEGLSEAAQTIKHNTPSWVSTGIDLHMGYQFSFDQNISLGQNSFVPGRQALSLMVKANEKIALVVVGDYNAGYPKAQETYGLISDLPNGAYIKLGYFHRSYGLELADDKSLVRESLGFSFDNDITYSMGMEAGIFPDPFFLNAALLNGSVSAEKDFAAKGGVCFQDFTLGASIYGQSLDWEGLGLGDGQLRYNAFGWARLGKFVLLAEYDRGYNGTSGSPADNLQAYHVSLETDLGKNIYVRGASEYLDHENLNSNDGFRHVLTLRCYPVQNCKLQIDAIRNDPKAGSVNYGVDLDGFLFY